MVSSLPQDDHHRWSCSWSSIRNTCPSRQPTRPQTHTHTRQRRRRPYTLTLMNLVVMVAIIVMVLCMVPSSLSSIPLPIDTRWVWLPPVDDDLDRDGNFQPRGTSFPTPDPTFVGLSATRATDYPPSRTSHAMIQYPMGPHYPVYIFGGSGTTDSAGNNWGKLNDSK